VDRADHPSRQIRSEAVTTVARFWKQVATTPDLLEAVEAPLDHMGPDSAAGQALGVFWEHCQ
jgi:hypothetical protein